MNNKKKPQAIRSIHFAKYETVDSVLKSRGILYHVATVSHIPGGLWMTL